MRLRTLGPQSDPVPPEAGPPAPLPALKLRTLGVPLHQLPKQLGRFMPERVITQTLEQAAQARGLRPEELGPEAMSEILTHDLYRRMLLYVAPITAKTCIEDVLSQIPNALFSPSADLERSSRGQP